ncbi:structural maintenance of chromosomes flexible hinge domain-containing protein GMI1-like [Apium graveolens]|uniref:structural maintenance of chromosomes flexible hinge domain-containing protein GMI1-like n=1 Tax=Apium graveolens TaxID=4045 RepID=UPI003D7A54BB
MESTSSNLKRMHREEGREAKCPKRTKQLSKFEQIKQKYNFEAALADLIDNSLQASWSDHNNFRQISIDINKDIISIFHNGTSIDSSQETSIVQWGLSASREQELNQQSVGDSDLYLTPLFGKFGYGVAVSSMHLGRRARICSNTKASGEICIIDIESDGSLQDSSGALIKMTEGGMPSTSEEDLIESFRGRFTKVQIFDLHMGGVGLHKLLCRLKDIYFPYIQIDKTCALRVKPVEFQVNGQNLAYIDGGKVSITNLHACSGPEFKLQLCLSSIPEVAGSPSCTSRKGNARMTFVYFPIIQVDMLFKKLDVDKSKSLTQSKLKALLSDNRADKMDRSTRAWVKVVSLLVVGIVILAVLVEPLIHKIQKFATFANIPSFFVASVLVSLATSARTTISSIRALRKKIPKNTRLTFSEVPSLDNAHCLLAISIFFDYRLFG